MMASVLSYAESVSRRALEKDYPELRNGNVSQLQKRDVAKPVGEVWQGHLQPLGSIQAGGNGLTITGTVNGTVCEIVMDNNSNISIERPEILGGEDYDLNKPVNSCLRTVTGEQASILGKGQIQLGIRSLLLSQELWVADTYS